MLGNAICALRHAPEWEGVLWHNVFTNATVVRRTPPWITEDDNWQDIPWSDCNTFLATEWLQRQWIMVPASVVGQAIQTVAHEHPFHPVREYLDSLVWDGTPRIDTWLSTYLEAEDTPYGRAVGPRWLISAVARIERPGAQADCVLILEGAQGIRKSSALRVLGQPWFIDRLSNFSNKDSAIELRSAWIVEIAELDAMSRADISTTKAFIARTHDCFRPPYGKETIELPRQCVFAGTINLGGEYLKDSTGGRRFWPVTCNRIDIAALERDRDQLWAEARDRFRAGDPWWLEDSALETLAAEQQEDRYQGDSWDDLIGLYLENEVQWVEDDYGVRHSHFSNRLEPLDDVSVAEILEKALNIEKGRWTQTDQNRVVRSLVSMGFKQYQARRGDRRERRYRRDRLNEKQVLLINAMRRK